MTKVRLLLEQFIPNHYDITLSPDIEQKTFNGHVTINGELPKTSKSIWLHANQLSIASASINGKPVSIGKQSPHHEIELSSSHDIASGPVELELSFSGNISPSMVGIYISNFTHDGKTKHIVATQFESNHAREAFPSIDEPAAKATFQLTLISRPEDVALSNTPIQKQNQQDGRVETTFEITPRMSTYLLAFVCGELEAVERQTSSSITVKAWSSVAQPNQNLQYAADEAVRLLDFYEDFYGVSYPLSKCDLVALPDFDAGAMENWGLITFREIALLADPVNRSVSSEQYVSLVVAHELAHMWFGNLVTMQWWDDLWLNESFASIMEHIALNAIHPEWQQWEHYAAMDIISTTSRDIHADIQPISIELDDPDLIETMFDPGIVYTKGARLLKMLIELVGEADFKQALTLYFKRHEYKNATRNDLWSAISEVSGHDVAALMDPWLDQPGMPMLAVDESAKSLSLTQSRFIVDGSSDESLWPIPLLSEPELPDGILTAQKQTIPVDNGFHLFNHTASGHFITQYVNSEHRKRNAELLKSCTMSAPARVNYLNDLLLLSRAQKTDLSEALEIVAQLEEEPRFAVWSQISRVIGSAFQVTEGDDVSADNLRTLRENLARQHYEKLGTQDSEQDDTNTIQLRSMMLSFMLAAENAAALELAAELIQKVDRIEDLPSESRASILAAQIKSGDNALAHHLCELYPETDAEMQLDIVSAISATKDSYMALETLQRALGPQGFVRPQDVMRWIAIFLRNHHIRDVSWSFMVDNWQWLEETLMQSKSFDYLPTYCASVVSTPEMEAQYRALFEPLANNKYLKRNITIGLKDIPARIAWRQANESQVRDWLQQYARLSGVDKD